MNMTRREFHRLLIAGGLIGPGLSNVPGVLAADKPDVLVDANFEL